MAFSYLSGEKMVQGDGVTRDRIFFASILSLPVYIVFGAVNLWVHASPPMAASSFIAALPAVCAIVIVRFSSRVAPGGHCFTLALAIQVFGEMAFNGGVQAPAAALSLLIVPAAIFTVGINAVRPWAIVTVTALLTICILDMTGRLPSNELSASAQLFDRVFSLAAGIFISAAVVIQYERQATRAINKLVEQRASFRYRALHDGLTELPNRTHFYEHAQRSIDNARQNRTHRVIIYFDIDRFKQVNDQHGHAIGDALLKAVASRLRHKVRPNDLAARLAGDEFAVIADLSESDTSIEKLTQRLREITDEPFELNGHLLNVSISLGYACFPADGTDLDTLLRVADGHMYIDKSKRRNMAVDGLVDNVVTLPLRVADRTAE